MGLLVQNSLQQTRMEARMLLSSSYGEGTFHRRSYDLLQGKVRASFPCLLFLRFLQLEIFIMPSCRVFRDRYPDPCQLRVRACELILPSNHLSLVLRAGSSQSFLFPRRETDMASTQSQGPVTGSLGPTMESFSWA